MDRFKFFTAVSEDADEIMELYKSMIGKDGCTWSEEYPTEETLFNDIDRKNQFCLKDDNGCIIAVISIDEDEMVRELAVWSSKYRNAGELARLAVCEKYQNKGVAKELIRCVRQEMRNRGYDGIHFLASKTNPAALACYKNLDVEITGDAYLYDTDWWCFEGEVNS